MTIRAVVFDAFGTLIEIGERRSPYRQMMQWLRIQGRKPRPDDAIRIMTVPGDLRAAAASFGWIPPDDLLERWESDLFDELQSIRAYPDTIQTIDRLRDRGYRVGLCSNLAAPYGSLVRDLLSAFDIYALSYEVGSVKPQAPIYQHLLDHLECTPNEILFIGDTPLADYEGPIAFGMFAGLVNRAEGQALDAALAAIPDMDIR